MSRFSKLFFIVLLFSHLTASATNPSETEEYTKEGWSFIPLPAVGYYSNLGFQVGITSDIYNYGDIYPGYLHKFSINMSYYTKGSGLIHFLYDSKYLVKDHRVTVTASYIPNGAMNFYGFNGYRSPLLTDVPSGFYFMSRDMLRVIGDIQGKFTDSFTWVAGVSFFNYNTGRVNVEKYKSEQTLYDLYLENGIIKPNEKNGGNHIELRTGLVYDTRDHEPDPSRGMNADIILYGSPDIIGREGYNYLKMAASFRHYIPIINKRLTLAYRLSYQGTLAGNVPFYVQQNYTTLMIRQMNTNILGGATSLRGVATNRVVADGVAWANVEARIRIASFRLLKQNWYISTNPFFDAGLAVQPYRLKEMKVATENHDKVYVEQQEKLHMSVGIGLKFVMNDNYVMSIEWGKPLDKRDGNSGLYFNVNYLF